MKEDTKSGRKNATPLSLFSKKSKAISTTSSTPAIKVVIYCYLLVLLMIGWLSTAVSGEEGSCVRVKTVRVESRDLKLTAHGIGTLKAAQQVMIRPEISGVIESVHFDEGSHVEKGDLLFSIDDSKIRDRLQAQEAALEEARANLENARLVYKRRQRLFKQRLGTEEARDEARARYRALAARVERLKAEVEGVKKTLADTRIKAPFSGITGERYVDPGEWVDVGTPLVPLLQTDRLKVAFTVPEKYLGQVKTGQTVKVHTPAMPERGFTGSVYFVSPLIQESTRTLLVKAYLDNPEQMLSPGGFASVDLVLDVLENRPAIPEEALVPTRTGYMVFVIKDNVAQGRQVKVGLRHPGIVEIRKGLAPGETIIQSGHISVQEGDTVCSRD